MDKYPKVCGIVFSLCMLLATNGALAAEKSAPSAKGAPDAKPMVGTFGKITGTVEIQKFGTNQWIEAKEGMQVGPGDQVAAGIDGKAQLIFANSKTDVEPLAQFSVGRNYETKDQFFTEVFLQVGKIKSDVDKNSGKSNKFTVTTPSSVAGIRGTVLEASFRPGVGAVNTITEGAGYVAPVQPDKLPPQIQQILNIPPPPAAREAAAAAAEKAGAPAAVVAQIAAGVAPTEEARAVMAQIAIAGGASPAAAAAIDQGFASFATIAPTLSAPEAPVVGADVAPIAAPPPGAGAPPVVEAPVTGAPRPGAEGAAPAPGAEPAAGGAPEAPAATGMEALVAAAGGLPGGPAEMPIFGIADFAAPVAAGGGEGAGGPANPMEAMAALLSTIPGLVPSSGGPSGAPEPGAAPEVAGPVPGAAPEGIPGGEPGAPGVPEAPIPSAAPDEFIPGVGPEIPLAPGDQAYSPEITGGPPPPPEVQPNDPSIPLFQPQPELAPPPDEFTPEIDPSKQLDPRLNLDIDKDGMPNDFEVSHGFDPFDASDALQDADGDGFSNNIEFATNHDPHSDADRPTREDLVALQSGQGAGAAAFFINEIQNQDEAAAGENQSGAAAYFDQASFRPADDFDGDGMKNEWEILYGLDPNNAADNQTDDDGDGFPNIVEFGGGSNPSDPNSLPSATQLSAFAADNSIGGAAFFANEILNLDGSADAGSFSGGLAYFDAGSFNPDYDGDGIGDDNDGDGMRNDWEVTNGLDPNNPVDAQQDADGDGFPNILEFAVSSNPNDGSSIPTTTDLSNLSGAAGMLVNTLYDYDAATGGDYFVATSYNPDFDGDGMFNEWEDAFGLNPNDPSDASGDVDGDGHTNLDEFNGHSDPTNSSIIPFESGSFVDDDGDGLPNDWEAAHGLDPNYAYDAGQDNDGDGFLNIDEFFSASDPQDIASTPGSNPDPDGDGLPTSWELAFGLDPNNSADGSLDLDGDGFTTLDEFQYGSDPYNVASVPNLANIEDADADGMPDNWELANGLNPNDASDASADADADGYPNAAEFNGNSDPNGAASTPTASTGADDDADGMPNDFEMFNGFNPSDPSDASADADADGYTNLEEFQGFSNPYDPSSAPVTTTTTTTTTSAPDIDADGMPDAWELANGLNPNNPADATGDADGDGVFNTTEYASGSDPRNFASTPDLDDNDFDLIPNSWENTYGLNRNDPGDAGGDADGDGSTNLQEYQAGTDPTNPFVVPATDHGTPVLMAQYNALYGVMYDEHADGHRTYYNPDRAGSVAPVWAEHPTMAHLTQGYGYVYVGGTNFGADNSTFPILTDGDGDGHSPQATFIGTVFYDPSDANFGDPVPQYPGSQPTSADPDHTSWSNNPNPFHH